MCEAPLQGSMEALISGPVEESPEQWTQSPGPYNGSPVTDVTSPETYDVPHSTSRGPVGTESEPRFNRPRSPSPDPDDSRSVGRRLSMSSTSSSVHGTSDHAQNIQVAVAVLPCEFAFIFRCGDSFPLENEDSWVSHNEAHLNGKIPSVCTCWFCGKSFDTEENGWKRKTNFAGRMLHIAEHYRQGDATNLPHFDLALMRYLCRHKVISKELYTYLEDFERGHNNVPSNDGGGYTYEGGGYANEGGGYAYEGGGYAYEGGGYAGEGGGYTGDGSTNAGSGPIDDGGGGGSHRKRDRDKKHKKKDGRKK